MVDHVHTTFTALLPVASSLPPHAHTAPAGCGTKQGDAGGHVAPCAAMLPHSSQPALTRNTSLQVVMEGSHWGRALALTAYV